MNTALRICPTLMLTSLLPMFGATGQEVRSELTSSWMDNMYLSAGGGVEKLEGEDSAGFGLISANWGLPLRPPPGVALGLQLGGGFTEREAAATEWDATVGGFGRNFATFGNQQGTFAVLFDYQRTTSQSDLWSIRPVIGTTISAQDAVGFEGTARLDSDRRERGLNSLVTYWTRGWSERLGTEFGLGYEFRRVRGALFRVRGSIALARSTDLWCGGDADVSGSYAVGIGVTYRFGGPNRHASLHNVTGNEADLYTPFPTKDFPALLRKKK